MPAEIRPTSASDNEDCRRHSIGRPLIAAALALAVLHLAVCVTVARSHESPAMAPDDGATCPTNVGTPTTPLYD